MSFSFQTRQQNLKKLKEQKFDLLIIGGGITGAGIARDACSRGMKVALVEAQDFAIGTSSRSSKLVHGGVRYLENLEFSLVFEALAERALLFKMAPHLVHPLRFMIPIYKSSRVGYWKMLLGMWLYDLLALFETPQMHEGLSPSEVHSRVPILEGRELTGAVEYSDAYMDDDRLVIETLRDAHRMGATIVNYAKVTGANWESDPKLMVEDTLSGEKFSISAEQVVSGVGPWTDIMGEKLVDNWQQKLRPTKGIHLVFHRKTIPVDRAVVMAVEKRIIFVIPRQEMVIVGTTDTDYKKDPSLVATEVEDVQYILNALRKYFPKLDVTEEHIISSYSGVRPLVDDGSSTEGKTSREHSIFSQGDSLTFVAGGKYTTYRQISEDVVDHVLNKMPYEQRMSFGPSQTKGPLNPLVSPSMYDRAQLLADQWSQDYKINLKLVESLVLRHGEEARWVLDKISKDYSSYNPNEQMWMGEAAFAIEHTMCISLRDFYLRRSPLFLAMKDHGLKYIDVIIQVFVEAFNWSDAEINTQKNQLFETMKRELSWRTEGLKL